MSEMKYCSSNMFAVIQGNQDPSDALPMPKRCVRYTVKNSQDSTANMWVGLSVDASSAMILEPGESYTSPEIRGYYQFDKIYIGWDPAMSGGKGLVIQVIEVDEICD